MKLLLYTHSDYSFVWKYYSMQMNKFAKEMSKIILVNEDHTPLDEIVNHGDIVVTYNPNLTYRDRILSSLKNLQDDIVIFHHEDMFLYDYPNYDILREYSDLVLAGKADVIKLIKADGYSEKSDIHPTLYYNPPNLKFAIQPSVIKLSKLIEVFFFSVGDSIWSLEENLFVSKCINNKKTFYCYNNEPKRGSSHYDSSIYPYIATAIVKGKWNFAEYFKELSDIGVIND